MSAHPAIQQGNTAIVTGAAGGIGLAIAEQLSTWGMDVVLVDKDAEAFGDISLSRSTNHVMDVSKDEDWAGLKELTEDMPPVSVLINNAGAIINPGHTWENAETWQTQMDVNFASMVKGVTTFAGDMVERDAPGLIVNTGSKQGLTKPPGALAYNVSKAAVIAYSECLAYDLRQVTEKVTAHLLVPGFTYSRMISAFVPNKPDGAWTCEQVARFMFEGIEQGDFYILCPDNDVSREVDEKRLQWTADDLIQNRPALSRWHPDYAEAFEKFME